MPDVFTQAKRSEIMRAVSQSDTGPEMAVRRMLHRRGYRFRLHRRDMPGTPDIVLPKYRAVIFVHGCFWHGHRRCARAALPKSNRRFWELKVAGNKARDRRVKAALTRSGWRYLVVWQCSLRNAAAVERALLNFLGGA